MTQLDDTARTLEEHLSAEHLAMLRVESGISDEVIQTRGYRTITNRNDLLALGFAPSQCRYLVYSFPSTRPTTVIPFPSIALTIPE